jgi:crossover junction endodeoxyribonuclease RusA
MTIIEFFVPGHPSPQGSKSARRNPHTGRIHLIESSTALGPWRERIALAAHIAMNGRTLRADAITLRLRFVLPRPKSAPKRHTPPAIKRNGDIDKLARACLDALSGTIYIDDAQVTNLHAHKRIAEIGETPGVNIRVDPA